MARHARQRSAGALLHGRRHPAGKVRAWAATVPATLRNPLYHWTHLELARYFGSTELLNAENADRIWEEANERLATPELSVHGILRKFRVTTLCTTDDPADDLLSHAAIARSDLATRVLPAFRPDAALAVHQPVSWRAWLERLEQASGTGVSTLQDLLAALRGRVEFFHAHGCRLSDHGLDTCSAEPCTEAAASAIFAACARRQTGLPG